MQPQNSQIETLHQQASAHYLQGEFQNALDVWRELLGMNPGDERAQEGVRLCELLAEEDGATLQPESDPAGTSVPVAPAAPFAQAAEGFDDDLDELDEILESGGSAAAPTVAAESQPQAAPEPAEGGSGFSFDFSHVTESPPDAPAQGEAPTLEGQSSGLELGDPAEAEVLALGTSETQAPSIDAQSHEIDLPLGEPAPGAIAPQPSQTASVTSADAGAGADADDDGAASEAAAAELRSRVNELLAEALTHYEQDRKEESLAVLERIFILDENNNAALALYDSLQAELKPEADNAAPVEAADPPPLEAAPLEPLEAEQKPADNMEPALPPEAPAIHPGEGAEGPPPLPPEDTFPQPSPDQAAEEGEPDEETADVPETGEAETPSLAAASEKRRVRRESLLTRQNLILVSAVVLVVAVGAGLAFFFMRGSGELGADGSAPALAQAGGGAPSMPVPMQPSGDSSGAGGAVPGSENLQGAAGQPGTPVPTAEAAAKADELLGMARRAMSEEDYAGAVLAYNKVLEVDPVNVEARDMLETAGDLYREQKALDEKRRQAFDAFNTGNYRAALTILYRLPADEEQEQIERYKRNGWYNMGVLSLRNGDCGSATTNFSEARTIDPQDTEVLLAIDLAKSCRYSRDNTAFHDEVRGLSLRAIDD